MRAITAILLLSALGSLGCANRGMQPPDAGPGTAGNGATAGRGGQGGTTSRGGSGGTAAGGTAGAATGVAGTGGTAGAAGTGANCGLPADGGANPTGGSCAAMFNFETDLQGATINSGSTGFKPPLMKSGAFTFCGSGALAITSMFTGMSGSTTKGEVLLNLPGAPVDLTGKTITVHVASDPGCSQDLSLSLVLNTQAGPIYFTSDFPITKVTNTWKTGTTTVPAAAGSTTALQLSVQLFSSSGYQGTIYLDEIDVR
jgi:hypothetical protein